MQRYIQIVKYTCMFRMSELIHLDYFIASFFFPYKKIDNIIILQLLVVL